MTAHHDMDFYVLSLSLSLAINQRKCLPILLLLAFVQRQSYDVTTRIIYSDMIYLKPLPSLCRHCGLVKAERMSIAEIMSPPYNLKTPLKILPLVSG